MLKTAIYARYSSSLQRPTSIADQIARCREAALRFECEVADESIYADEELSGATAQRPAYQRLMEAARRREAEAIIVEAQDRLWRDQAEMHTALQRLRFWGVRVFSVETGTDLTDKAGGIVAAVMGWRDETFLDSLREKTRRGMLGQVRRGLSSGGRAYGYRSEPVCDGAKRDSYGQPLIVGYRRVVNQTEAAVVRRIFEMYADGLSPKTIAHRLNEEGVPPPRWRAGEPRRSWTWTTIAGSPKRASGILNNPLYVGRLLWNRSQKIRDPDSGKRVMRVTAEDAWVFTEVPELRIVPDELWKQVKSRQAVQRRESGGKPKGRPLRHMFSGLLRCAVCGGPYVIKSGRYYGCATNINRGHAICANTRQVRRDVLETRLLRLIGQEIFSPQAVEYLTRRVNEALARTRPSRRPSIQKDLEQARLEREHIKTAIRAGVLTLTTKAMLEEAEGQVARLEAALNAPDMVLRNISVLPRLVEGYLRNLREVMGKDPAHARSILRRLIGEVTLKPNSKGLMAVVRGNLAGILDLSPEVCDTIGAGRGI